MAYILKSIAATQFLSNMLFIYFLWTVIYLNFHNCYSIYKWVIAILLLLLVKMWKITNISKTVRDRPAGYCKSVPCKGQKFQFSPLLAAILDFCGKWKSVNISRTVRDRAISSEFSTHRVLLECPMQRGKISIFATFGGHLGFLWKMKKCEYLENRKR